MSEDFGPNFVTLTDDEGNDVELEYVDALEYNGTTYMAFFPVVEEGSEEEENEEEYGLVILKSQMENGEEFLEAIEDDAELEAVYSALMVAATPVCNAIFSGILNASGYDQSADVALNTLGQSAAVNTAISVSYIWVETAAYALCAVLVFLWTVEKNLPAEQAAIVERKKGATQ